MDDSQIHGTIALRVHLDPALPCSAQASRTTRRCSASASAYPSAPSSCKSRVDPSTSVKRKVTVPVGSSFRIARSSAGRERASSP
jgi:hypothetical protein